MNPESAAAQRHARIQLSSVRLDDTMLKVINFLILTIWWAGFVTGHTLGGLIHLLLLLALIVFYIQYLERHKQL